MSLIFEPRTRSGRAALRRLLQLDQPAPPRSENEIAAEVERNYRWNFTFNLLDGVVFWFAFSFASATTIVPLFVSKLSLNPLLIGLVAVIAQSSWYLPRCFPVNRRGRFFGLTTFIGTGVGAIGAMLSSWLLEAAPFPFNFVYLFFIAAVAINVSWAFLAQVREPVQPMPPAMPGAGQFRAKLWQILRRDHNFRSFLRARLLLALGGIGTGFITIAAIERWHVSDSTVGLYTAALLLGQTAGNLLAGLLADRFGHKLSLEIGAAAALLAFALAWLAPSAGWYYLVFVCLGMSYGITIVSGILIIMEFTAPAHRPTYIGITNTA
ncbi:MAG: MFS transporter, partial [Chloroflexi bacterium]|nr:MFS transporter [Chloroflexota bacterium]